MVFSKHILHGNYFEFLNFLIVLKKMLYNNSNFCFTNKNLIFKFTHLIIVVNIQYFDILETKFKEVVFKLLTLCSKDNKSIIMGLKDMETKVT